MKIVIVGGGKVGYYLTKTLLPNRHQVTIIEKASEFGRKIADELEVPVVRGDGTDIETLRKAGVDGADVFIAVTGQDEDNLISCQLAKRNFGAKRTIARVNNPKNSRVFEKLGVDMTVSSTAIIADMIEEEIDNSGFRTLLKLHRGNLILSEVKVSKRSPGCNHKVKDMELPKDCILVTVVREEGTYVPNGHTIIREGDTLVALCQQTSQEAFFEYFNRG